MDMKGTLCGYLQSLRDTVLWKVEGVSERDLRMPMTSSGTNLLGLVKHLASTEAEYFGECLGQPWPEPMPWLSESAEPNADMWATADESPEQVIELYRRVHARADARIAELPLEASARVPWWDPPETTLHRLLVHMIAETGRHAGHMDILREGVDGQRGLLMTVSNLPPVDDVWWRQYVARLRDIAENSGGSPA
jgi:uncharacterized damage-inducible protein DinB